MYKHTIGEKSFKCSYCNKEFQYYFIVENVIGLFLKKEILRHIAIYTGKKPDPCTKCGKAFSQKVHLKHHMTIHCDKFFLEKKNMNIHPGEIPVHCS